MEGENIVISEKNKNIFLPQYDGDVLFVGEINGLFGTVKDNKIWANDNYDKLGIIVTAIIKKHNVIFCVEENSLKYVNDVLNAIVNDFGFITAKNINKYCSSTKLNNISKIGEIMKFDYIIQNPPYKGSLHLDFFEKGLDILKEDGKMVIIEPATWLINVRKNGKAKRYDTIKERINGHVQSVVIENLNKEFGTNLFMPFAITTIDKSKTYDTIQFKCCGENKEVNSLYDCNLVGDYKVMKSILDKVLSYNDLMVNHITREDKGINIWYSKYAEIDALPLCQVETPRLGRSYDNSPTMFSKHMFGSYCTKYSTSAYHYYQNTISDKPLVSFGKDKKPTTNIADNVYGTREELENWKHFIFNNKLPLFINIVMTIDQNNNSKEFLPWLVDKQYTDEEINELFGFTEEEIALIDRTIKKYERNSPWFKRYMCGPESVTDDEVNNFIEKISK